MKLLAALLMVFAATATTANACGTESQCKIGDRHYYIAMPDGHDGTTPVPALIFAHGFQGSGLGIIRNPRLRRITSELGIAFIAVKSRGSSWATRNAPRGSAAGHRGVLQYFDDVIADASRRFPIDTNKIVMGGASTGGMLTWTLACERSDVFAGFIPMSGTFWTPEPQTCQGPVANIVHFHGDKDKTVPLEGRPVAGTHQGSVSEALAMYTGYGTFGPAQTANSSELRCELRKNRAGNVLNFCLYDGGHSFRSSNVAVAWRMLQEAGQL